MILNFDLTQEPAAVEAYIMAHLETESLTANLAKCEAERTKYYKTEDDGPNVWYSNDVALLDDPSGHLLGYHYGLTMLDRFLEHFNFDTDNEGNTVHVVGTEDALFEIGEALQTGFMTNNNVIFWLKQDDGLKVFSVVSLK